MKDHENVPKSIPEKTEIEAESRLSSNTSLPSSPSWVPSPLATVSSPYSQDILPSRLAWSPTGHLLAVASDDARVRLFPVTDNLTFGPPTLLKEGEFDKRSIESWFQIRIQGSGCMTCAGVRLSQIPLLSLAGKGVESPSLSLSLWYHFCGQCTIIDAIAISTPGINLFISGALMSRRMVV